MLAGDPTVVAVDPHKLLLSDLSSGIQGLGGFSSFVVLGNRVLSVFFVNWRVVNYLLLNFKCYQMNCTHMERAEV